MPAETVSGFTTEATRKSSLRQAFSGVTETIARTIDRIPGVTANDVTYAGGAASAAKAVLATNPNVPKEALVGLNLLEYGADGFDGSVARLHKETRPERVDPKGGEVDARVDRLSELANGLSRMVQAHKRGDLIGELLAAGATVTNFLPSKERARGEAMGIEFDELGRSPIEFAGTRVGRAILSETTIFPDATVKGKKIPLQQAADAVTIIGNLTTYNSRKKQIEQSSEEDRKLPLKMRQEAAGRKMMLDRLTAVGVIGVVATFAALRVK